MNYENTVQHDHVEAFNKAYQEASEQVRNQGQFRMRGDDELAPLHHAKNIDHVENIDTITWVCWFDNHVGLIEFKVDMPILELDVKAFLHDLEPNVYPVSHYIESDGETTFNAFDFEFEIDIEAEKHFIMAYFYNAPNSITKQ